MNKTIKEWLEELPEPYRTQALENMYDSFGWSYSAAMRVPDMREAILNAFIWIKTPQGDRYWYAIMLNPLKKLPATTDAQQECINGRNSEEAL